MTQNADNFLFYAGINTFGGYKYTRDLKNIDIAIMGAHLIQEHQIVQVQEWDPTLFAVCHT
ncbi:hypothetical protein [Holzapfeliella floricola]|uniref:Uncharacterized protein n=1 Tax=Holzapfeliella floricola DSM 23037 = JCM 16512 TaxID=1423744 RepID=A0A0R2DJY8_9LACO|nr:hypothetical protein [Holzapfeliella floricola]KRN04434.1 hypothetical protein FC86_GL000225 [Holzapfeliella floricola DSM 23037 = JCM 16512]